MERALAATAYPLLRRVEFRGKRRLRRYLPVPAEGEPVVAFPGGVRMRLDLRESLQRDFYFGLCEQRELDLVRRLLAGAGDFVDVGAHVGMYTLAAARSTSGRVLAFEPNPRSRARLQQNVELNGCANVILSADAVSDAEGETLLHVPAAGDAAWSTLGEAGFDEGEPVRVRMTTVDAEAERWGIEPAVVKIDTEGHELRVVAGMERTLERRPSILCEVGPETAGELERLLAPHGYASYVVEPSRLVPGPIASRQGLFNALFLPPGRPL